MADREGFEPSIPLRVYTRSRRAPSTTRPPVRIRSLMLVRPPSPTGFGGLEAGAGAPALKAADYSGAATRCKVQAMLKARGSLVNLGVTSLNRWGSASAFRLWIE